MSESNPGLLGALRLATDVFDDLGIDYLVGGSIASSLFGEPRQTIGADILARILGRHAEPLVQRLKPFFYIELQPILEAVGSQGCFNIIHLETMSKIDVFIRWRDPFGRSQFERRQRKWVGESEPTEFFFASPEDTVIAKLEWFKRGGETSDRQWRDVLGVLKVQSSNIDQVYLKTWAAELGLMNLLLRALTDAGLT